MSEQNSSIADNVALIRARIERAAQRSGRTAEAVRLVAVTKKVVPERIREALAAGISELGENYIQEAREKIPEINRVSALSEKPTWHLIGHLQSNKAKYAVNLFSVIQSVDSYQLAQEINRQVAKEETRPCPVLIEVQLGAGEGRAGISEDAVEALADQITALPGLHLQGLMAVAPYGLSAPETRPYFERMRLLFEALPRGNRQILSMGMSGDFEVAIEEGATLVRVGTALFGARKV